MKTRELEKLGFIFEDGTLEELIEKTLTNFEIEYNECGGYITCLADGEEVLVCFNKDSDEMFTYADAIIEFLTKK